MKRELTYATVCSGIECMSAAVADLPMKPVFFSEIEPYPCAVLKHRFPYVTNLGDMSKIEVTNNGRTITNGRTTITLDRNLDVFAGGTPCQDVSNAGKKAGMAEGSGTRSSLAFEFVRLVRELHPRYVIWENVAGVLSDPSFPKFLAAIADCGYGVAYRTLDAQYVRCADIDLPDGGVVRLERAVPQRRRRVWVVGCAGEDIRRASEILFEPKSVCGDHPPRRITGQEIAAALRGRNRVHGGMVGEAPRDGGEGFPRLDMNGVAYCSDGGEVAATITRQISEQSGQDNRANAVIEVYENHAQDCRVNMNKLGGDNQTIFGGGTLSMNFEMFDKAEDVNVNLCAKRAHDCMVIENVGVKQSYGINPQGGGRCCHLTRSVARLSLLVIKEEL